MNRDQDHGCGPAGASQTGTSNQSSRSLKIGGLGTELPQHPVWPKQQRHYGFQIELPCPTGFLSGLGFLPPSFLLMLSSNNNDSDDPSTLDIVLLTLQSWSDHPPSPTTTIINNHHLTTSALAPSTYLLPSPGYYRLLPSQFPPPTITQPAPLPEEVHTTHELLHFAKIVLGF